MSFWAQYNPETVRFYPDPEDTRYYWEMRSPTFRDERKLIGLNNQLGEDWTVFDVAVNELVCTFHSTTFPTQEQGDEPDPEPILAPGASPEQILAVLELFPAAVVLAMWETMKEVAPHWGPVKRQEGTA